MYGINGEYLEEQNNINQHMRNSITLHLLMLATLCLSSANAASTHKYAYTYDDTDFLSNLAYVPVYDLGILEAGWTIQVTIKVPNIATTDIFRNSITDGLTLLFQDNSHITELYYSRPKKSDGHAFLFTAPTGSDTTFTGTYTIFFQRSYYGTSSKFRLGWNAKAAFTGAAGSLTTLDYVNIEVFYFQGTAFSVESATPPQTLLKVTETGRQDVVKVIYVAPNSPALQFAFYPFTADTTSGSETAKSDIVPKLYKIGLGTDTSLTANEWALTQVTSVKYTDAHSTDTKAPFDLTCTVEQWKWKDTAAAFKFSGKVAHWEFQLDTGFYLIEHYYTGGGAGSYAFNTWFTFQTDAYACPYDPEFGDYYGNFQGCTVSIATEGLPCASFDAITRVCSLCIDGYILENGSCYANTTCPARQYFHFGKCLPVSETCGDFDKFTGVCFNCADPTNFENINGSCTHKAITCPPNQYQTNYTCYNASLTCGTFDPNSGKCLTCLSELYQLNTDGTCSNIIVICPQGQYAVGLKCVTIPVECLNFDTTLQKCLGCIQGYYADGGVCKKIVCPDGQVPSKYGIFCVSVSSLCGTYDSLTGACLSCKNNNHAVRNGQCVQLSSPLAGCQERQNLGFGPCVDDDIDCKTFNLQTGVCDQCKDGYYLDYTGHCLKISPCASNQWSVNGECLGFPENCLSVDSLGLCTACVSKEYRLQQGQCVYFKTCVGQQYLNEGGQCADVNTACATWNPSNGQCITCKTAGTSPVSGVCCPKGQIYSSGKCVDSNTLQQTFATATGSSCLVKHPALPYCLRCTNGHTPDYTIPYGCGKA